MKKKGSLNAVSHHSIKLEKFIHFYDWKHLSLSINRRFYMTFTSWIFIRSLKKVKMFLACRKNPCILYTSCDMCRRLKCLWMRFYCGNTSHFIMQWKICALKKFIRLLLVVAKKLRLFLLISRGCVKFSRYYLYVWL